MKKDKKYMQSYCLATYNYILEFGGKVCLNLETYEEWCNFFVCLQNLKKERTDVNRKTISTLYECLFDTMCELRDRFT